MTITSLHIVIARLTTVPMYYIILGIILVSALYVLSQWAQSGKGQISVLVLGDLGHSPRMQNHVACLVSQGLKVVFIGYLDSELPHLINTSQLVKVRQLMPLPETITKLPRTIRYLAKFAFQTFQLLYVLLCRVPKTRCLLLQCPPSIPTLMVAAIIGMVRGHELCVDWHNYGFTLMGLQLGGGHPIVSVARMYERALSHVASHNFCVTHAMQNDLSLNWGVTSVTLHDKPNPERFNGRLPVREAHELFARLKKESPVFGGVGTAEESPVFGGVGTGEETRFTRGGGTYAFREDRPLLLVSGTSWTEDEDFGTLLDALQEYDTVRADGMPRIVCAITGKGPLRAYYESEIRKLSLSSVEIITLWLSVADYPCLLAVADLGVSLHSSSSGLDLPMKVVDMFGCDLPVLARNYSCIGELVQNEVNGFLFETSHELCTQLIKVANGFPAKSNILNRLSAEIRRGRQSDTWQRVWKREAAPYFNRRSKPSTLYFARLILLLVIVYSMTLVMNRIGLGILLED